MDTQFKHIDVAHTAGRGQRGWRGSSVVRDANSSVKDFSASITAPEDASYFAYKTGCLTSVFPCDHPHNLFLRS